MNIKKRLKRTDGDGVYFERQVFGANIQILRKKKFQKNLFQFNINYTIFCLLFDWKFVSLHRWIYLCIT